MPLARIGTGEPRSGRGVLPLPPPPHAWQERLPGLLPAAHPPCPPNGMASPTWQGDQRLHRLLQGGAPKAHQPRAPAAGLGQQLSHAAHYELPWRVTCWGVGVGGGAARDIPWRQHGCAPAMCVGHGRVWTHHGNSLARCCGMCSAAAVAPPCVAVSRLTDPPGRQAAASLPVPYPTHPPTRPRTRSAASPTAAAAVAPPPELHPHLPKARCTQVCFCRCR